jgi:hypothetical protein
VADHSGFEDEGTLVLEQRFAIVPEWIIDAQISDCAFRLYAVLLRYGQTSGQRMPGRALLAKRLHKASKDTVDRALKELVGIGAVVVERRRSGRQNLTNRYHVRSSPPGRTDAATPSGRNPAATPPGRTDAATPGRTRRATVAAAVRPDPEVLTEKEPPPTPPAAAPSSPGAGSREVDRLLLARCGIEDLSALASRCQELRRRLRQPSSRWAAGPLMQVLRDAILVKGWPASRAAAALLTVAGDPATKSPQRLPCPGPWWDEPTTHGTVLSPEDVCELHQLEARLLEADGRRVWLQQRARAELAERGQAVSRLEVARRACQLLDEAELTPC